MADITSDILTATGNVTKGSVDLKSGVLKSVTLAAVTDAGTLTLRSGGSGGDIMFPVFNVGIGETKTFGPFNALFVGPLHATIDDVNTSVGVTVEQGS